MLNRLKLKRIKSQIFNHKLRNSILIPNEYLKLKIEDVCLIFKSDIKKFDLC